MLSEDLIKSIISLINLGKGDKLTLYYLLDKLRRREKILVSDQRYLEKLISEHLKKSVKQETSDDEMNHQ